MYSFVIFIYFCCSSIFEQVPLKRPHAVMATRRSMVSHKTSQEKHVFVWFSHAFCIPLLVKCIKNYDRKIIICQFYCPKFYLSASFVNAFGIYNLNLTVPLKNESIRGTNWLTLKDLDSLNEILSGTSRHVRDGFRMTCILRKKRQKFSP